MKLERRGPGRKGKLARLSKATSDDTRPVINAVWLKIEKERASLSRDMVDMAVLYATNAYFFVRHVLPYPGSKEMEEVVEGPIPQSAMKHIETGVQFDPRADEVKVGPITTYKRTYTDDGYTTPDPKLPKYEDLKPSFERTFRVAINAGLMKDLADALGDGVLTFEMDASAFNDGLPVSDYNKVIIVKPTNRDDGEAILMPVRLNPK